MPWQRQCLPLIMLKCNFQTIEVITSARNYISYFLSRISQPYQYIRFGIVLMVFGEIGNFSAYGFAPASLVAPLGTTTVIGKAKHSLPLIKLVTAVNLLLTYQGPKVQPFSLQGKTI